jgi:hypothetical protein
MGLLDENTFLLHSFEETVSLLVKKSDKFSEELAANIYQKMEFYEKNLDAYGDLDQMEDWSLIKNYEAVIESCMNKYILGKNPTNIDNFFEKMILEESIFSEERLFIHIYKYTSNFIEETKSYSHNSPGYFLEKLKSENLLIINNKIPFCNDNDNDNFF